MIDFDVRRAEPADAPIMARVHVDTWRETYRGLMRATLHSTIPRSSAGARNSGPQQLNLLYAYAAFHGSG